jgi:hypothetical protein
MYRAEAIVASSAKGFQLLAVILTLVLVIALALENFR